MNYKKFSDKKSNYYIKSGKNLGERLRKKIEQNLEFSISYGKVWWKNIEYSDIEDGSTFIYYQGWKNISRRETR